MTNKALFLDFDGVLFNTIKEVYLVNRCIYKNINVFEPVDNKEFALYSKYKFLVYNIWMFAYYNPIIFNNTEENKIVDSFSEAILKRNREFEEKFYESFLNIRYDLIKNHYDFWKNLEEPYQFFFFIKELHEKNLIDTVVVSKKNKSSIVERFSNYNFKFDSAKIYADEILSSYSSKGDFIEEYMDNNNIETAIFVDDNSNNLKTVKNDKKVKPILALWGNNIPNESGYTQEEAEKEINYFISK